LATYLKLTPRFKSTSEGLHAGQRFLSTVAFDFQSDQALAPFQAAMILLTLAKLFGGGELGRQAANLYSELQRDLPLSSLTEPDASPSSPPEAPRPDPTESSQIQRDQPSTPRPKSDP
jgi:hypothetical protein